MFFKKVVVGRLLTGRFRCKPSFGQCFMLVTGKNNFIEIWGDLWKTTFQNFKFRKFKNYRFCSKIPLFKKAKQSWRRIPFYRKSHFGLETLVNLKKSKIPFYRDPILSWGPCRSYAFKFHRLINLIWVSLTNIFSKNSGHPIPTPLLSRKCLESQTF